VSGEQRAVVWLPLARGGRRAVEVGIDPAELERALAKWRRLLGPTRTLQTSVYPARADAGPPTPSTASRTSTGILPGRWWRT
jgi:hypothetical protein